MRQKIRKTPFWYKKIYVKWDTLRDYFEFKDLDNNTHTCKTMDEAKRKIDSFYETKNTKKETISF